MNSFPEATPAALASRRRAWRGLVFVAVPLASFLSFSVQPIVGKYLVPWQGGSAGSWISAMLFFQTALVLGYLWAYWLGRRSQVWQTRGTITLSVVAATATLLPPPQLVAGGAVAEILLSLMLALLPAMVLLFSAGLLLHGWLGQLEGRVPYFLYSISNIGSLGALAFYPTWIEPHVGLGVQAIIWRGLLVMLAMILSVVAAGIRRDHGPGPAAEPEAENIPLARKLLWLWLSALTCTCMLGATQHLSAELGSNPLTWIIPLGLYLASFSVTFSGWWREGASHVCLAFLAVGITGFTLLKGVMATPVTDWTALWLVLIVAAGCCFGTGLLHSLRPRRQFLQFYVVIGVGGMIGGVFSSVSAPNFLPSNYEFLGSAALLLVTGVVQLVAVAKVLRGVVAAVVVLAPILGAAYVQKRAENTARRKVHHVRNIYGHVEVIQTPGAVVLRSETTAHGSQIVINDAARRRPTLYYVESSAVGTTLLRRQAAKEKLKVGVVGLGAGTLATYARPGDIFTFWDIDPKVFWLARTAFTYVNDARGTVILQEADGRKALENSTDSFDVLVIDAFTGDSIPAHLLTIEAIRTYLDHLEKKNGLLLIHTSNRYIDLMPVITANARALGWDALLVNTTINHAAETRDLDPSGSNYVIVHRPPQRHEIEAWFPPEEDKGRVKWVVSTLPANDPRLVRWTDDRYSITDVLEFRRYLEVRH